MSFVPCLGRPMNGSELRAITLGHPLVDAYLEFVGARGARNTWLATAYDLKVFFEAIGGKKPAEVASGDVFAFLGQQRTPRHENVVRIEDGEAGLSARTIARRLSSIAGLFEYLILGDAGVEKNPVPRGLAGRRAGQRGRGGVRLVLLVPSSSAIGSNDDGRSRSGSRNSIAGPRSAGTRLPPPTYGAGLGSGAWRCEIRRTAPGGYTAEPG